LIWTRLRNKLHLETVVQLQMLMWNLRVIHSIHKMSNDSTYGAVKYALDAPQDNSLHNVFINDCETAAYFEDLQ